MKRITNIFSYITLAVLLPAVSCVQEGFRAVIPVKDVTLLPKNIEIAEGGSRALKAHIFPLNATDKSVSFNSSDSFVASVDGNGLVKGMSPGEATVTVVTHDGDYRDSCVVKVLAEVIAVDSVFLNETSLFLNVGGAYSLVASVIPDNATEKSVRWSSDNESVVSVSQEGYVKALKSGTATITATATGSDKSASCAVTVGATIGAATGASSHISCRNAVLSGTLNFYGDLPDDLEYGVMYSTSRDMAAAHTVKVAAVSYDATNCNFSITSGVLEPSTTYYYCAYVSTGGDVFRGTTNSFTTRDLSTMLKTEKATSVHNTDVVLNASYNFTDCVYEKLEYGFEITSEDGVSDTKKLSKELSGGKFSAKIEPLIAGKEYAAVAFVTMDGRQYKADERKFLMLPEGAVDLGLSVLWATCNLGASKPEERGGHYQWAGTTDVTATSIDLNWSKCPYHTGSNEATGWTKYVPSGKSSYWSGSGSPDDNTVLDRNDDAASVILGSRWCTPTIEEWNELINSCSWKLTSVNGVSGYQVTSKMPGYEDISIFLPSTGYREGKDLKNESFGGNYLSSSLNSVNPSCTYSLEFTFSYYKLPDYPKRCIGQAVRPVWI